MNFKKSLAATLISTTLCIPAIAQDTGDFSKRIYLGISGGGSRLTPESQNAAFTVDDESDAAGKVFIGYDFSPRIAVELMAADLGAAGIGPNEVGEVDYSVVELSGLYHVYNLSGSQAINERRGLGAFVKLGLGFLDNDSNLQFTRDNDFHVSGGIGIEYALRVGLAIRGEVEAFDEDALMSSIGVLYRFGGSRGGSAPKEDDGLFSRGAGVVGGVVGGAVDLVSNVDENDDDQDGVPNSLDDCMGTPAGAAVSATGCEVFGGVLEGVNFESASDRLLDEGQVVLNDAADVLLADPDLNVEVQAHTDSQGAAQYNIDLSKQRALAVVRYLILRGVPAEQMTARAFGESKPIADNATAEGRKLNRRVEFHVIDR